MDAVKRMEELQQRMLEMTQSGNMDMAEYMQIAGEMQNLAALAQQQQLEELTRSQQEQHARMLGEMGAEPDPEGEASFQAMLEQQRAQFMDGMAWAGENQAALEEAASAAMGALAGLVGADDEELTQEEYDAFVRANAVPAEFDRLLPIGALLIGTHEEPYETLALMQDRDYTHSILEGGWGIEGRQEALDMLASLLGGRHANRFADTYAALRAGRTDGLDEDDVDDYETAVGVILEALELPRELVDCCETLIAWDLERVGYLARLFVNVGYLTEAEAWEWMAKAAAEVKRRFGSWEEYMVSLLLGRSVCYGVHQEPFAVAMDLLGDSRAFLEARPVEGLA